MSDTGLHYVIERQAPDRAFRYKISFIEGRYEYMTDYADTLWGARWKAKRLAAKWRRYRSQDRYVDEGLL